MSAIALSSGLLRGGLILIDPASGAVQRVISLQYNPETLTRTLQPQAAESGGPFSEPLRLKGPPTETFKLDAEIDAADQLEFPDQHPKAVSSGIHPQLAALETIVYPDSDTLIQNNTLLGLGTLEIAPTVAPLTLFVWSKERVVPVRITDFSVTEEWGASGRIRSPRMRHHSDEKPVPGRIPLSVKKVMRRRLARKRTTWPRNARSRPPSASRRARTVP